jgi:hypothetical protein
MVRSAGRNGSAGSALARVGAGGERVLAIYRLRHVTLTIQLLVLASLAAYIAIGVVARTARISDFYASGSDVPRSCFLWAFPLTAALGLGALVAAALLGATPPSLDAMPSWLVVLLTLGAVVALLALAGGLLETVANALSHDLYYRTLDGSAPAGRRLIVARASVVLVAGIATAAILNASPGALSLAPWTFSLAASGLFPALALGLWWGRANRQGAVAGMIAGAALCLYYMLAPRYIPIIFYETSSLFSNATHEQAANYLLLKQTYSLGEGRRQGRGLGGLGAGRAPARQLGRRERRLCRDFRRAGRLPGDHRGQLLNARALRRHQALRGRAPRAWLKKERSASIGRRI